MKFVGMAGRGSDRRGLCASDGLCHLRFFAFLAFCPPARGIESLEGWSDQFFRDDARHGDHGVYATPVTYDGSPSAGTKSSSSPIHVDERRHVIFMRMGGRRSGDR